LLVEAALLADYGVRVQENLEVGIGKNHGSYVAPFHDHAASKAEFALTGDHPRAHCWMYGNF